MKLTEQLYRKLNKEYYHGTLKGLNKAASEYDWFFITTNYEYALSYAICNDELGEIYSFRLKKEINIFNANCKSDIRAIEDKIRRDKLYKYIPILDKLKKEDWSLVLNGDQNRDTFVQILKELGYDGFFNFEYTESDLKFSNLNNIPSIGIFDISSLCLIDRQKGDKIKDDFKYKDILRKEISCAKSEIFILSHRLSDKEIIKEFEECKNKAFVSIKDKLKYLLLTEEDFIALLDTKNTWIASFKERMIKENSILKECIVNNGSTINTYDGRKIKLW